MPGRKPTVALRQRQEQGLCLRTKCFGTEVCLRTGVLRQTEFRHTDVKSIKAQCAAVDDHFLEKPACTPACRSTTARRHAVAEASADCVRHRLLRQPQAQETGGPAGESFSARDWRSRRNTEMGVCLKTRIKTIFILRRIRHFRGEMPDFLLKIFTQHARTFKVA